MLVNLISNAIKFTETGEVTLTSKLITKRNEACRVQFNVSDSGIGIQNDKLDKIFNSFTQANADTSRKYGGTGLGLTIVKNLLDLMGSSIKVKSQPGHGSTFQFELNLGTCTSDDFSQVEYEESNNEGKLSGYRILLAEDNKVNQLFASELISEWGAVLDIADNGKIAVEYVAKNQYDLVLMDIQMPEMSGLEATTVIRNEFTKPANEIIIIAMTANAMKGDENQFRKAGMNDVIFKPYHANELYLMLCKHLKVNEEISVNKSVSPLEMPGVEEVKEPILKHINLHTLKSFSRGKNAFIVKMLNALVESVPPTFNELDKAIQSKDWISVNRFSHKLIPNMNMIGNPFLETEIKCMEDNAVDQKSQIAILSKWSTIKQEMQKSIEELRLVDSFYQSIETKNKN
ncbi:MAG: response regulator [Bacteroidetes bacterium]|nr:response regulator [Bacteroidota bacterium]